MEYLSFRRWFWYARRHASALGWPGMAALLLLAGSAAFALLTVRPMQERVASLRQEAKSLRDQSYARRSGPKILNPAEQLAEYYRFFPREDTITDAMATLYSAAAAQNLNLEQADYRLVHGRDDKLTRYEVVLPVKGGYVQVRKFMAQALTDLPNLSLDSITFSRQKIGDPAVEAQLRFTLHFGKA